MSEDASESVSNGQSQPEADDEAGSLLKKLIIGFTYLRQRRDARDSEEEASEVPSPPGDRRTINSCTVVNFIEPRSASASKAGQNEPLDLYSRLTSIFEEEYGSMLRDIPYKHARSGQSQAIESLTVYPTLQGAPTSSKASGRGINRVTSGLSDPSEWHNGPYCHVYIAACESVEHYRSKVRPSLQAFVSQLEQAAAANSTPTSGGSGTDASPGGGSSYSAHYVIVFVPIGDMSDEARAGNRFGSALASRMAAARQRMRANPERETTGDSGNGLNTSIAESTASSEMDGDLPESTQQMSKMEKELMRRFKADFPNGQVCIMSTLSETEDDEDADKDASVRQLRKSEWATFQRCLGAAVVDGFKDRCQRYDEELRRLDVQRGAAVNASNGKGAGADTAKFNLGYYFLVKESLAFTYEQMCLPSEALLQYNELRALLPDVNSESIQRGQNPDNEQWKSLSEMALAENMTGFRRRLRDMDLDMASNSALMEVLDPIAHVLEQYLFLREVSLLFKMDDPVKVVNCCRTFVETMFDFQQSRISPTPAGSVPDVKLQQQAADAERWAFEFCWNVKRACDCYLTADMADVPTTNSGNDHQSVDRALAHEVCDVLEFARLRLLQLGDSELSGDNPVRLETKTLPDDIQQPWPSWVPCSSPDVEQNGQCNATEVDASNILNDALSSSDAFQKWYLELSRTIVTLNRFSGRLRTASRLQTEMLEIYILRGEKAEAIKALQSISSTFAEDQWSFCHFILLFRLAGFQRQSSSPADYLETLVRCFSESLSSIAPSKATNALHADLEAVVCDPSTTGSRFESPPLFGANLNLKGMDVTLLPKTTRGPLKKLYSVGEKVCVTLELNNYLPKEIEVNALTVSLVPFQTYVAAMEDSIPIQDKDVARILSLKAPVSVKPGKNHYELEWIPMMSGQFILSSIGIEWHGVRFVYKTSDIQKMAVRIDVVPCEPTQSIEVRPVFLIPGHEQPVRIAFSAGSDIVKDGTLQLACSPGLLLQPPDNSPEAGKWIGACNVTLPPCAPGETVVVSALVKSIDSDVSSADTADQRLHVEVTTSFLFDHPDGTALDDKEVSAMTCVLESVIPSLGKATLSVESVEVFSLAVERCMVSISLLCNTPVVFTVKSWELNLPPTLSLEQDGDMNSTLVGSKIIAGERLLFGFACAVKSHSDEASAPPHRPTLQLELEDEHGTTFNEVLSLSVKSPLIPKAKLTEVPLVPIALSLSASDGPVCAPIDLVYSVDTTSLFTSLPGGTVLYQVDVDDRDWFVSGKAEGVLAPNTDDATIRLDFVAIPVRPGTIAKYPSLELVFEADDSKYGRVALMTQLDEPEPFHSISPTDHMSVAYPIGTAKLNT